MITAGTINELVSLCYSNPTYDEIIHHMMNRSYYDDFDEVKHEIYTKILDSNLKDVMIEVYNRGEFNFYFAKICYFQLCSKKSKMWFKYVDKHLKNVDLNGDGDGQLCEDEKIIANINNKMFVKKIYDIVMSNIDIDGDAKRNFEIFKFYFLQGLSGPEIAQKTGIKISRIYVYINQIKEKIKKELNDDDDFIY